jgi:hypothetical protein
MSRPKANEGERASGANPGGFRGPRSGCAGADDDTEHFTNISKVLRDDGGTPTSEVRMTIMPMTSSSG